MNANNIRRFTERKDPHNDQGSDYFAITAPPEHANGQTKLSTKDSENHVTLTATNVPENLYLLTSQSGWSVDSSETDTDDTPDSKWVKNESKVDDIIDRGREIMALVCCTLFPRVA